MTIHANRWFLGAGLLGAPLHFSQALKGNPLAANAVKELTNMMNEDRRKEIKCGLGVAQDSHFAIVDWKVAEIGHVSIDEGLVDSRIRACDQRRLSAEKHKDNNKDNKHMRASWTRRRPWTPCEATSRRRRKATTNNTETITETNNMSINTYIDNNTKNTHAARNDRNAKLPGDAAPRKEAAGGGGRRGRRRRVCLRRLLVVVLSIHKQCHIINSTSTISNSSSNSDDNHK